MKGRRGIAVTMTKATRRDLRACHEITMDSILGEKYFSSEIAEGVLAEGIANKEVTVAKSSSGEVVGYYRLALSGMCLVFAYIHLIAVKASVRGSGIGTKLLAEAEREIRHEKGYPLIKKSFLLVAKSNRRAAHYYTERGYKRAATLHDLFAKGDTEYLMVKDLGKGR